MLVGLSCWNFGHPSSERSPTLRLESSLQRIDQWLSASGSHVPGHRPGVQIFQTCLVLSGNFRRGGR